MPEREHIDIDKAELRARAVIAGRFGSHADEDVLALIAEVRKMRELARAAPRVDSNEIQPMIDAIRLIAGEPC